MTTTDTDNTTPTSPHGIVCSFYDGIEPAYFWRTPPVDPLAAFPHGIVCSFYDGRAEIRELCTGNFLKDVGDFNVEGDILHTFFSATKKLAGVISSPAPNRFISTVFDAFNLSNPRRINDFTDYDSVLKHMKTIFGLDKYDITSPLCVVNPILIVYTSIEVIKDAKFGEQVTVSENPLMISTPFTVTETAKHAIEIYNSYRNSYERIPTEYDECNRDVARIIAAPDGIHIAILYRIKKDNSAEIDFINLVSRKHVGKILSETFNPCLAEFSMDGSKFVIEGPPFPTTGRPDRTVTVYEITPPMAKQEPLEKIYEFL